jgi:hypothetical protein
LGSASGTAEGFPLVMLARGGQCCRMISVPPGQIRSLFIDVNNTDSSPAV